MEVIEETDPHAWDRQVLGLGGHPLQSSAWGELKSRFGWRPIRLSTTDGAAAAQLLVRPLLGLSVVYVPRGPMFSGEEETDRRLLAAIEGRARRQRAAFIRLEPNIVEGTPDAERLEVLLAERRFRPAGHPLQPRASLVLDLSAPPEALLAGFSKGHRADIRRAQRDGVSVRTGGPDDVKALHRLLRATQRRKSFAVHSAAYYRTLLELFGEQARLLLAEHAGAAVAASLVLAWGAHGIYLVAGSDESGLRHRAGHLLQWHAIRWARERGARTYDLWGIPDARALLELGRYDDTAARQRLEQQTAADPLDGVYRFKKGWAAQAIRLVPAYDRVYFPPAYWLWQRRRGGGG